MALTSDQQWALGTAAKNGADGDTAREAAVKYNAHTHQTESVTINVAQATHGFVVGDVLYVTGGDTYAKANANAVATAEVVGLVVAVPTTGTFTLLISGKITGLSGLTAGTLYFLSSSVAGESTATEPATAGHVSKPLFVAINATEGIWVNYRGAIVA